MKKEITQRRLKMRYRTKIAILLVAVLLTVVVFNLMVTSSSALDILKIGKQAGYEIIANVLAKAEAATPRPAFIKG
jgi:hypothetical protein